MSPAELEALLAGLLRLWQVEAALCVRRCGDQGILARIEAPRAAVKITYRIEPFGPAWHVEETGQRRRTYPSTIGPIRHLRESLAPERGSARVVFAAGRGG
jgi:hypothetical protein